MTHTIAIIGSGHIGAGLGRAWRKRGHAVTFGTRNPAGLAALCAETGAKAAPVSEAAASADVVVLAMPWGAVDEVVAAAGASLAGKIVIDCTNAVTRGAGGMALQYGHTTSSSEELRKKIPAAKVWKSFNAQGAENLRDPVYGGVAASNFFCGDDDDGGAAKKIVAELVEHAGFEPVYAGPLHNARLLEPLMLLWIDCAQELGTRDIAFKLLRR